MRMRNCFICLIFLLFITSCAATNGSYTTHKLEYREMKGNPVADMIPGVESCANLYQVGGLSIVEVYCSKGRDGLYIHGEDYQGRFDWYDSEFSAWAAIEGCNSAEDCHYQVKVDNEGVIREFRYVFSINQSEGFYRVRVEAGKLEVLEREITDYP